MTAQEYHRIDLAIEQLEVALRIFLDGGSYVSALTLAGAAEEILGTALTSQGGETALKQHFETTSLTHQALHGRPMKWQDFKDGENLARNAAKHIRMPSEATITVDIHDAALWMLVRACANYDRFGLERTENMQRFDNWFYENWVGFTDGYGE